MLLCLRLKLKKYYYVDLKSMLASNHQSIHPTYNDIASYEAMLMVSNMAKF